MPTRNMNIGILSDESVIDHDALLNFEANEHIDWTDTDENLLTTGSLDAGAITGTSFIIGGNTLDTNEFAFLDGQDQSVVSGATPTFTATNITGVPAASVLAGTLGTGAYVFDNTVSGITDLTATSLTDGTATLTGGALSEVTTITASGQVITGNIYPATDDTHYLGKNDDDSPAAWKGLILKDQTDGKYYRIELNNGAISIVDLTD